MNGRFYLAWRYCSHHRGTTAILVTAITLIAYLPMGMQVIVADAEEHFRGRSRTTPLVVGPRGSRLELVLASLYFDEPHDLVFRMDQSHRLEEQELGWVIPLHLRFVTRECPVVGTTAHYLAFRELRIARGDLWDLPGECVIGADAAKRLDADVGARIPVTASSPFLLDSPPLRLRVAGILAPTETPDDQAIFVHLRTSWILEGLGHGHAVGARHGTSDAAPYTDVTPENVDSFHFHGDESTFPVSAIIVVPVNDKAKTLLLGQYLSPEDTAQIAQPAEVVDSLLAKVVMVRSYMIALVGVVSGVTLLTIALVIVLSVRLRRGEIMTVSKIGCSHGTIAAMLGGQMLIVLAFSGLSATILTLLTDAYGRELAQMLIL